MVVWRQWKLLQNQYGSGYYYGTYFLPHCFLLAKSGVSNSVECRNLFFIFKVHVSHYFMLLCDLSHRFVFCPLLHTDLHFSIILDLDCYTQILTGIDTEKPSFLRNVWGEWSAWIGDGTRRYKSLRLTLLHQKTAINSGVRKWSSSPSLFFNSTALSKRQEVVAMVMQVLPVKGPSLYTEMSREVQKKKREPIFCFCGLIKVFAAWVWCSLFVWVSWVSLETRLPFLTWILNWLINLRKYTLSIFVFSLMKKPNRKWGSLTCNK